MQTKEQMKSWKFVASVATVAALGVSGYAIASTGGGVDTPAPIEIRDQRATEDTFVTTTTLGFEVVPAPSFSHVDSGNSPRPDLDSPLTADSPVSVASRATIDSPTSVDTAPKVTITAVDSPSPDAASSPATPDSPDAPDSPVSADSPVSGDSPSSVDS